MQGQDRFFVLTIFLVVVLSIFQSGEALKCYQCYSWMSKTCEKEPTSEDVLPCSNNNDICISYIVENIKKGQNGTVRGCSVRNGCNPRDADGGKISNCNECSTDLCNASATNAVSTVIMITSGLITLLWTIQ